MSRRPYSIDYAPLLERVIQEQIGLWIETNNPKLLQIEIANYISDHKGFADIIAAIPSVPDAVFLVNKSAEVLL